MNRSFTAFAGTYSHVLLDSIMHPDIRPLAPFTASNPMLGVVSLGLLHLGCLVPGLLGALVLMCRKKQRPVV